MAYKHTFQRHKTREVAVGDKVVGGDGSHRFHIAPHRGSQGVYGGSLFGQLPLTLLR